MGKLLYADIERFPNETIDSETVLIDSTKGHLYLFTGAGPWIWQQLVRGATPDSLAEAAARRFGPTAAEPTRRFVLELESAGMLVPEPPRGPAPDTAAECPQTFSPPTIERYDQIADILSMDPIHDVDRSKGWPHKPDTTA